MSATEDTEGTERFVEKLKLEAGQYFFFPTAKTDS